MRQDKSDTDSHVSRESSQQVRQMGKEGKSTGERGTEAVNNRYLAKCIRMGKWRRTKGRTI